MSLLGICLLGLVVILFFAGRAIQPVDQNEYLLALFDKDARLAEKSPTGRIVFIGGSNLAFGVNSEEVEKAFDTKTINMGLAYDLGLKFMLHDIDNKLVAGDTVVIVPEYQNFFGNGLDGGQALANMIYYVDPSRFKEIDTAQFLAASRYLPMLIFGKLETGLEEKITKHIALSTSVNQRKNFNKYGDMIGHLEIPNQSIGDDVYDGKKVNMKTLELLNDFARSAETRDIKVFFLYPSYRDSDYEKYKPRIEALRDTLSTELTFPVLSSPERYRMDSQYFFNSSYHVNKIGREIRTKMIIQDLKKVLSTE